jgi:hypothetical protein
MSFIIKETKYNSYVGIRSFKDTRISVFPKHPNAQDNHHVEVVPLILWNFLTCFSPPFCEGLLVVAWYT